jgi:hypothetical protein
MAKVGLKHVRATNRDTRLCGAVIAFCGQTWKSGDVVKVK